MTTYLSPLVKFTAIEKIPSSIEFGKLTLRKITDDELFQYFQISDRRFGPGAGEFSFTKHSRRLTHLHPHQEFDYYKATHGFFSTTTPDEHRSLVNDILHCWRLLIPSQVSCPITFYDQGPGSFSNQPAECRIGEAFIFSEELFNKTKELLANIKKVPQEDLEIIDLTNEVGYKTLAVLLLVIVAERSLMHDDKNEISFKVAFYGARLLEDYDGSDIEITSSILEKAYSIRSKFVHSGLLDNPELSEFLPKLYKIIARIRILTALNPSLVNVEGKKKLRYRK
ncbi:MAG: hypothetical protein AB1560_03720 [Pseudomonadota bacterium]